VENLTNKECPGADVDGYKNIFFFTLKCNTPFWFFRVNKFKKKNRPTQLQCIEKKNFFLKVLQVSALTDKQQGLYKLRKGKQLVVTAGYCVF